MLIHSKKVSILSLFALFIIILPVNKTVLNLLLLPKTYSNVSSQEVIDYVNSLRSSNGLPPYQVNPVLMTIAQNHSDYQASIGAVTHYGPDGSRPFQRALAAGYPVAGDLSLGGFFSENIAAGRNFSALDVVNSWQLDAPHLNTMLSATLQDIGAGVTIVGDYVYFTIDVGLSSGKQISTPIGWFPTIDNSNFQTSNKIFTSTPQIDGSVIHEVKIGETIWSIALAYKVKESEILQLNSLQGDIIYVGQKLIIRLPSTPTPILPSSTKPIQLTLTPSRSPTPSETSTATNIIKQNLLGSSDNKELIIIAIITISILSSGFLAVIWKKRTS